MSRSAISEIFGYVKLAHKAIFNEELTINYESSSFEATRFRRPLPQGWNGMIGADPQRLLDRGFDKVIYVSRDLAVLCEALALYHRQAKSGLQMIQLYFKEPDFFESIQKKWEMMETEIQDPRFFRFDLDDWNNHTLQIYNELLDFLEFPLKNRPFVIPVRAKRDFDAYSCSHLDKDYIVSEKIELIRSGI